MVCTEKVVIHYYTGVTLKLVDFESSYLTNKLQIKLSNHQSPALYIERLIAKAKEINMYAPSRNQQLALDNVFSKYHSIIESEQLRKRNSKLAGQADVSSRDEKSNPLLDISFFKLVERSWRGLNVKMILGLGENGSEEDETFTKLLMSTTMKSFFFRFIPMTSRHQRLDRLNYLRFSLYFVHTQGMATANEDSFNSNLESEYLTRRNEYPLKVFVVIGKNSMEWAEHGFVQVEEVHFSSELEKSSCLKRTFLACRDSDTIHHYLNKVVDFNCKWNASMFYDPIRCNSGHYVKGLLSYLNVSLLSQETQALLDCVCESKSIPLIFPIPHDLIIVSVFQTSLSTFFKNSKFKPKWAEQIVELISNDFYGEYTKLCIERDWDEIHSFYTFFLPYLKICPCLDISFEFSFFLLALLESNHQVMSGELYESLLLFSRNQISEIMRRGRDQSYHNQVYNFSGYSNFKNTLQEGDACLLNQLTLLNQS